MQLRVPVTYWHRHLGLLAKYGTMRKIANLSRALMHYALGSPHITAAPSFLKVEISRYCTVHCKSCTVKKAKQFFDFDEYRTLIDQYQDYLFEASLYDDGEPLYHDRVIDFIRYAHQRHIGTVISTSLSVEKRDDFWKEFMDAGLDRLIVAIDGVTPAVYQQYRTHGQLDLVFANLRQALHYKRLYCADTIIEWQMIDFPWNRCEQEAARRIAAEMGCDTFKLIADRYTTVPSDNGTGRYHRTRNCLLPYIVLIIDAYRQVHPCYKAHDEAMNIGNLHMASVEDIWNSEEMASIRSRQLIRERETCCHCRE